MSENASQAKAIVLSAKFTECEGAPLPGEDLLLGMETYEGDIVRVAVALSEKGGAKRKRIRPTLKVTPDASAVEIADQVHAIAWADVCERGETSRYVAELTVTSGDGTDDQRVYFTLRPNADVTELSAADSRTDGPSLEYVRGLEQLVVQLSSANGRVAIRQSLNEAKRLGIAWDSIDRQAAIEVARGRVSNEALALAGSDGRKDKMLDGAISLLPMLAARVMGSPQAAADAPPPWERLTGLLDAKQLDAFAAAIGDVFTTELKAAKTIEDARVVLVKLDDETQTALLGAIGPDNVLTIASWK